MAENEKKRLYQRIIQQNPDEVLLQRMRLHGFWPQNETLPQDPPDEAKERAQIESEIAELRKAHSRVKDPEKSLAEERKRRWKESKQRRAERKKQRELERKERRSRYDVYRHETIVHTGAGVSYGLEQRTSDETLLIHFGLPVAHTGEQLAEAMGIDLPKLRWLTYHRKGATVVHYHRYSIAKKTGGVRNISAPKPALAEAQQWVLENILLKMPTEPEAHGFISERSIVTNATPHVNRAIVINMDLQNFFPSITFRRVKGLFRGWGYSEHVATVLALLCTEPPRVATELDGKIYHVALGERVLPQGACTSPAITNLLCRRMDRRLAGLAEKHNFNYTRYADDLTFSGDNGRVIGRLLRSVRSIIEAEGFTEHPRKTRVMRRSNRQEVTGVTVNERPTVSRKRLRKLRAILHNVAQHGIESQNRDGHPNFAGYLRGQVEFACMVDPENAPKWRNAFASAFHVH